ncbi:MAG: thiamine pyrophosphate-dependent enzyme, partial [Anaerovoracaceae bacterium]
ISNLDCMSCGCCERVCPAKNKAIEMKPVSEVNYKHENWEYGLTIKEKSELINTDTIKGSQFKKPLLEFSGACAGCGETPYIKLLTQLYGDKMYFANATGCTQAWGSAMPCVPYTTTAEGKGPAWSNSLFENNAEFSYGMCLAVKQQRDLVTSWVRELKDLEATQAVVPIGGSKHLDCQVETSEAEFAAKVVAKKNMLEAIDNWLETYDDLETNSEATKILVAALEESTHPLAEKILSRKDNLSKKTMWMVGGDGWAYDIGYGGLDHVFAMGEDVNVLIVDTEVYSNTGGQSSKATPIGAVAQFQASGKKTNKKDLGMQLMTYGNVYVANVAMGANQAQVIKALKEAEAHKGPSIVIAYAPCINHGIKKGMSNMLEEMKDAVDSGYWFLYRYDPNREAGKFVLDSKEPKVPLREFFKGEVRYASLEKSFPKNAEELFAEAEKEAEIRYKNYKALSEE